MLIRNGKTIQFVRENSMLDIQQLLNGKEIEDRFT